MAEAWYVAINGKRQGPLSGNQIRQMAANGAIGPADLLWKEGMAQWVRCDSVKGLFAPASGGVAPGQIASTPPRVRGGPSRVAGPPPRRAASPPVVAAGFPTQGIDPLAGGFPGFAGSQVPGLVPGNETIASGRGLADLQFAEFMPRVGAALLDGLFLFLVACIPMGLVFGVVGVAAAGGDSAGLMLGGQFVAQVLVLLLAAGYFILLDSSVKQGTWGKQIVGIKVTDLEGRRITSGRAAARFFSKYFLTNCTFGIGYLMPLFTQNKQTLHDLISGCVALKK
jgi:uncharacterized RDD family membrane protein YckC